MHIGDEGCPCTDEIAHNDLSCIVYTPEYQEREAREIAERKEKCGAVGHPYDTGIGVGFGVVDYFCDNCGALVRSVPVEFLDGAEAKRIGVFVTDMIGDLPIAPTEGL